MKETADIDGRTVQQIASMSGVDLSLDRAALAASLLRDVLAIDRRIAELGLGTLSPLGSAWSTEEVRGDEE
jgi:hypothetical protein